MAAPDDFLYEYSVVRYVPRVDREEFINIGLLMLCKRRKWLKGQIHLDTVRLKAFDPSTDVERLSRQASLFTMTDQPASDIPQEEKYRWLSAVKSAVLQVSPSHPGILPHSESMNAEEAIVQLEKEFNRLFTQLIL
ncbi:MAG: DUF3037 domain-containing protein [Muribaculaceae bacterium]|nr:DUF3037 domain-containing protein [Muribaculaceae bacterium]